MLRQSAPGLFATLAALGSLVPATGPASGGVRLASGVGMGLPWWCSWVIPASILIPALLYWLRHRSDRIIPPEGGALPVDSEDLFDAARDHDAAGEHRCPFVPDPFPRTLPL